MDLHVRHGGGITTKIGEYMRFPLFKLILLFFPLKGLRRCRLVSFLFAPCRRLVHLHWLNNLLILVALVCPVQHHNPTNGQVLHWSVAGIFQGDNFQLSLHHSSWVRQHLKERLSLLLLLLTLLLVLLFLLVNLHLLFLVVLLLGVHIHLLLPVLLPLLGILLLLLGRNGEDCSSHLLLVLLLLLLNVGSVPIHGRLG